MIRIRLALLVASLALGGCSSEGTSPAGVGGSAGASGAAGAGGSAGMATGGSAGTGAAGTPAMYPPGPYGNQVGDVFPPLTWEGFVNDAAVGKANAQPFGAYSSEALMNSGRRLAFVHLSEFF